MTPSPLPVVRLRPGADARKIRFGAPWVYTNEIVTDRRTKAITPGAVARLQDKDRADIALIAVNPGSRIFGRVLDRDCTQQIDRAWIAARLRVALAHRDHMYADPYYRLIHAEADGLPGVVIDRFGDIAVLQPNAAWAERLAPEFAGALNALGMTHVLKNASGRTRKLEGLDDISHMLTGRIDGLIPVPMNGASYCADLLEGQKTGLFFDQRPNHAFAAGLARGGRVLDVFSHIGGFSHAALAAGAAHATALDSSAAALELAIRGASASGHADSFATLKGDAFAEMEWLGGAGQRFDMVVADPPAFAPGKSALEAGLRAYERTARLAARLVETGGYLVLCSCSHAADLQKFRASTLRGIGRAGRQVQLIHTGFAGPDHPQHPALAESGYLKALFFRVLS